MSHEWHCACPRCLRDWRVEIEDERPDDRRSPWEADDGREASEE